MLPGGQVHTKHTGLLRSQAHRHRNQLTGSHGAMAAVAAGTRAGERQEPTGGGAAAGTTPRFSVDWWSPHTPVWAQHVFPLLLAHGDAPLRLLEIGW